MTRTRRTRPLARENPPAVRDPLVVQWLPLVHWQVRRMLPWLRTSSEEYQDAVAAGNVGLVEAARRFDVGRGVQFNTYAVFWIRQAVQREEVRWNLISVPDAYLARRLHKPSNSMACAAAAAVALRPMGRLTFSKTGDSRPGTVDELAHEPDFASKADGADNARRLWAMIQRLPWREELVIVYRFYRHLSLEQIGRRLGRSKERVRQLELAALVRLRRWCGVGAEDGATTPAGRALAGDKGAGR